MKISAQPNVKTSVDGSTPTVTEDSLKVREDVGEAQKFYLDMARGATLAGTFSNCVDKQAVAARQW